MTPLGWVVIPLVLLLIAILGTFALHIIASVVGIPRDAVTAVIWIVALVVIVGGRVR